MMDEICSALAVEGMEAGLVLLMLLVAGLLVWLDGGVLRKALYSGVVMISVGIISAYLVVVSLQIDALSKAVNYLEFNQKYANDMQLEARFNLLQLRPPKLRQREEELSLPMTEEEREYNLKALRERLVIAFANRAIGQLAEVKKRLDSLKLGTSVKRLLFLGLLFIVLVQLCQRTCDSKTIKGFSRKFAVGMLMFWAIWVVEWQAYGIYISVQKQMALVQCKIDMEEQATRYKTKGDGIPKFENIDHRQE